MVTKNEFGDASKKRSIARRFNDSLVGRSSRASSNRTLDQRIARRLDRYRGELEKDCKIGDKGLTPLDIATRVNELLKFGDRMSVIRKLTKAREIEYDSDQVVGILKEMHPIYDFRPEAYRFAGVKNEELVAAGVLNVMPVKRGPVPGMKPAVRR